MKTAKTKRAGFVTTTVKALLLGTFAIAVSVTPALQSEVRADRLDKSSPKIAHGMYKDRGKSSPKIAHGMYRDRGKSSPKIAPTCNVHLKQQTKCKGCTVCWFGTGHGMWSDVEDHLIVESSGIHKGPTTTRGVYRDRGKSSPKIAEGMADIMEENLAGRTRSDERFELAEAILMALEIGEVEVANELLDELNSLDRTRR